jgi:DNA-binding transcriptional MocR family regulator
VLDAVRAANAFLVEDDYARDLALDDEPPPPLVADDPDGHVVYLRSLTKSTAPGCAWPRSPRAGPPARAARRAGHRRLLRRRAAAGGRARGRLLPRVPPASPPGRRGAARAPRAARRSVARHVPGATFDLPAGGLNLWLRLPEGVDDVALATDAARLGVVVSPGRPWFPAEAPGPFLRLSFAGTPSPDLERGVELLGQAVASH